MLTTAARYASRPLDRVPTPLAVACFVGVYLLRPDLVTETRILLAWNGYAAAWLAFSWLLVVRQTPEETSGWARTEAAGSLLG
ncbi:MULTISPECIES: hypothetical protein [Halorussus]|uniref:hypothetical protein n=1 Tax=Halorussus TaxID=1070314 RepID=UPI000E215E4A|nr:MULTISPECIES: hypothetical protein [Halorussus]NHN58465.1 DUF1345 domain-containing protein [Halorussus sp. JP-T4]